MAPAFTDTEMKRLRAALRNLRALYGSWSCLAAVMGVYPKTLQNVASGRKRVSPAVALATAKAAGKTLDALIRPPGAAVRCLVRDDLRPVPRPRGPRCRHGTSVVGPGHATRPAR
ncbi:MAG: hypothetical protein IT372_19485 [Polyangiaceae bacterium]|nr:hypothetical protein [Polyangiaceae bacterium]